MRVALCQMTSGIDPAVNAITVAHAIESAAAQNAEILFTPEMTGLLDRDRKRLMLNAAPAEKDLTVVAARKAACAHNIWVHIGSVPIPTDGAQFFNRGFLISNLGEIFATYDKIHRFDVTLPNGDVYRESNTYQAGKTAPCVQTPFGKLGLTICYDVRFPHLYRRLAQAGAQIIAVPAAFTVPTGAAHWHTLLRARAIETGAWIIAAAQSGMHGDGRTTYGHSLVINPWGEVVLDMGTNPAVAVADIDLAQVSKARAQIPAWQTDIYFEVVAL
jgi:deaminated glutathione amidase